MKIFVHAESKQHDNKRCRDDTKEVCKGIHGVAAALAHRVSDSWRIKFEGKSDILGLVACILVVAWADRVSASREDVEKDDVLLEKHFVKHHWIKPLHLKFTKHNPVKDFIANADTQSNVQEIEDRVNHWEVNEIRAANPMPNLDGIGDTQSDHHSELEDEANIQESMQFLPPDTVSPETQEEDSIMTSPQSSPNVGDKRRGNFSEDNRSSKRSKLKNFSH